MVTRLQTTVIYPVTILLRSSGFPIVTAEQNPTFLLAAATDIDGDTLTWRLSLQQRQLVLADLHNLQALLWAVQQALPWNNKYFWDTTQLRLPSGREDQCSRGFFHKCYTANNEQRPEI